MSDQLSKVFAALADPTRRDIVARLSVGDATVNAIAAPYEVSLQAVSKHLKVLEDAGLVSRSREAQRRPVHLEAEVFDLMTEWIERYQGRAEERLPAPRRGARRARRARRPVAAARPTTSTHQHDPHHGRTGIMTTTQHPGPHRGRREGPDDPHLPRLRRHPGAAAPGPPRPRAVRPLGRPGRDRTPRSTYWDARDGGAWRYVAGRGRTSSPPSGAASTGRHGPIVQTFTWEGMPEERGPGDPGLRGPRRRPHPAARDQPVRLLRGAATAGCASGMETGVDDGYAELDRMLEAGEL